MTSPELADCGQRRSPEWRKKVWHGSGVARRRSGEGGNAQAWTGETLWTLNWALEAKEEERSARELCVVTVKMAVEEGFVQWVPLRPRSGRADKRRGGGSESGGDMRRPRK